MYTLIDFLNDYPDDMSFITACLHQRFGIPPVCPKCGKVMVNAFGQEKWIIRTGYSTKGHQRIERQFRCNRCREYMAILNDTPLHKMHSDLATIKAFLWFEAYVRPTKQDVRHYLTRGSTANAWRLADRVKAFR